MGFLDDLKKQAMEQAKKASFKNITLDLVAGYKNIKGKQVTIFQTDTPRVLKFASGILSKPEEYQVKGLDWEENFKRSAGKAAAGAIVGGVLTGGLGAIAGAAIGGKRKNNSSAVITIDDNGIEGNIFVRCNSKEYQKLTELL